MEDVRRVIAQLGGTFGVKLVIAKVLHKRVYVSMLVVLEMTGIALCARIRRKVPSEASKHSFSFIFQW